MFLSRRQGFLSINSKILSLRCEAWANVLNASFPKHAAQSGKLAALYRLVLFDTKPFSGSTLVVWSVIDHIA